MNQFEVMQPETRPTTRKRWIAWLVLAMPLLIYALVWPVRARLDRGVIERHWAGSIWRRMSESLPGIGPQIILEVLFWFGAAAFMAGSIYLVWLALDGAGSSDDNEQLTPLISVTSADADLQD